MKAIEQLENLWHQTTKDNVWQNIPKARALAATALDEGFYVAGDYMEGFMRLCKAVHNKMPPAGPVA